ncbi:MAG: anti-sigma factor [Thiothrix sp.]
MKRYQNPEVFERLAMSYALGTLQGSARQRFESLLEKHFYLRAVTAAYQKQFAGLVEMIPPVQPPARIWKNLEQQLDLQAKRKATSNKPQKQPFWRLWQWPATAFATLLLGFFLAPVLNPPKMKPENYVAVLESSHNVPMAYVKVAHADMQLSVKVMSEMPVPEGMELVLWCVPKQKGMRPMRMGTVASNDGMDMPIDKTTWKDMGHIEQLAISEEPMGHADAKEPMGDVMYTGKLQVLALNN